MLEIKEYEYMTLHLFCHQVVTNKFRYSLKSDYISSHQLSSALISFFDVLPMQKILSLTETNKNMIKTISQISNLVYF